MLAHILCMKILRQCYRTPRVEKFSFLPVGRTCANSYEVRNEIAILADARFWTMFLLEQFGRDHCS